MHNKHSWLPNTSDSQYKAGCLNKLNITGSVKLSSTLGQGQEGQISLHYSMPCNILLKLSFTAKINPKAKYV